MKSMLFWQSHAYNQLLNLLQIVATCLPVSITNGEVEYHLSEVNGSYPTGTLAFFTCDDEYMRTGSLFSTCQGSGIWSPDIPLCEEGIQFLEYRIHFYDILLNLYQIQKHRRSAVQLLFSSDLFSCQPAKWECNLQHITGKWKIP